jgi:3-hydroxyisobutyrate dehydrogenase-like beta-hydroxyacid dehydrogenase
VAVFDPEKFEQRLSQGHLERLIAEDRIDHMASADYRPGSLLTIIVKGILGRMARHAAG